MAERSNGGLHGDVVAGDSRGAGWDDGRRRSKKRVPQVYFIENGSRIKIGFSNQAERRIAEIGKHLPGVVEVIGIVDAPRYVERSLHKHFEAHRIKGEWFIATADMRAQISAFLERGPDAIGLHIEKPKPLEPSAPLPERAGPGPRRMRQQIMQMMWGDDALAELAGLAEVPIETAKTWFDCEVEMPDQTRYAVAGLALEWMFDKPIESFKHKVR